MGARLGAVILISVLAALGLTGSGRTGAPWAVGFTEILSHPEARLFYPGSRLQVSYGWAEYAERCGDPLVICTPRDVPAIVRNQLLVEKATPSQIFGWYQGELSASGWHPAPLADSVHFHAYVRGPAEQFDVKIPSPEQSAVFTGRQRDLVLYYARYQLGTCPSIDAGCRTHFLATRANDPGPPGRLPTTRLYVDDVADRPEAHLYFPGSSPIGSEGQAEGAYHLLGVDNPSIRVDLITPAATRNEIERWYRAELAARGYELVVTNGMGAQDLFRRGPETFKLLVGGLGLRSSRGPYGTVGLMFSVVYEIDACALQNPRPCRG